jgi:hypothetical protein
MRRATLVATMKGLNMQVTAARQLMRLTILFLFTASSVRAQQVAPPPGDSGGIAPSMGDGSATERIGSSVSTYPSAFTPIPTPTVFPAARGPAVVSSALGGPLKAAQSALQSGNYRDAVAQLNRAESTPGKTAYDEHVINQLSGFAYIKAGDYANSAKAFEATLADGYTTPNEVSQRIKTLTTIYYQLHNYGRAADFGIRAVNGGFADQSVYTLVSQAYYLNGDFPQTVRFTSSYVDSVIGHGQAPNESSLQLILGACGKLNDQACQVQALERLAKYYPKPQYMEQLQSLKAQH